MARLTGPRRAGHILGIVLALGHLASLGIPTDTGEAGPPLPILVAGALVGLAVLALLVWSWAKDRRGPRRIAAILLIVAGVGALPGLLVADLSVGLRVAAGVLVLLTIATVVLLFYPQRGSVPAAQQAG